MRKRKRVRGVLKDHNKEKGCYASDIINAMKKGFKYSSSKF